MTNIELLEYCKKNTEHYLDSAYMFVEIAPDLDKYLERTALVKKLLIEIKNEKGVKLEASLKQLSKALDKYSVFSEFGAFVNAADSSVAHVKKDPKLLQEIVKLYFKKRSLNKGVPSEWIQAMADKNSSSRRKGQVGEEKLIKILKENGYVYADKFNEFMENQKSVAKFRKDFTLKKIKENFGILIGKSTQGKKLDLCIKSGKDIYFLEAKHLNNGGGGQNKQIKELIDVIKQDPEKKNHHFVSFMDGVYFNFLWRPSEVVEAIDPEVEKAESEEPEEAEETKEEKITKIQMQVQDINEALKKYPDNYFINTAGFKKLFE